MPDPLDRRSAYKDYQSRTAALRSRRSPPPGVAPTVAAPSPRARKYRNQPTVVDGITFHSKLEAERYRDLRLLEIAGRIQNLELQPKFPIIINGVRVTNVLGDFSYVEDGKHVVEDTKGYANALSRLKAKLVSATYPHLDWRIVRGVTRS